jgi:BirA family biotin operon repressor/biotin-[acetyl-CoA-carboxylase] ligase
MQLADGEFHSGEALAKQLNVSRTAIWKLVAKLESWQIDVYAVRGKGYKIPNGLKLLNSQFLKLNIKQRAQLFSEIDVLATIDSTSSHLTRAWQKKSGIGRICVAEHQSLGRGRKGRKWVSPFGANLYFSLGLNLPLGLSALGGLSIAIGLGLTEHINNLTSQPVKLKWPNDLLVENKKLAGILVEASGDSNDTSFLNIGIGINWNMVKGSEEIDQPWVNLKPLLKSDFERTQVLTELLLKIDSLLSQYIESGFESFRPLWKIYSAYNGKPITLHTRTGVISGIESGIDRSGAIIIETAEGKKLFHSGEVSLRASV